MDLTQITSTTWRGLSLPVFVALNCHQQPYILPHVRIVQPQAWHEELVRGLEQALHAWRV